MTRTGGRAWSWRRRLVVGWLALLVASHATWAIRRIARSDAPPPANVALVPEHAGARPTGRRIGVAWEEHAARAGPDAPVLVLLHGSPGSARNFDELVDEIGGRVRLVVPSLPGFGDSETSIADYSIEAQARELLALLDELGLERVHVLGFSLGGGVALEMAGAEPARIRSLVLLSSVGVQELEFFGGYELNHALHGLQLSVVLFARWLFPHFGLDDGLVQARSYAKSFFDTDQRPLRAILASLAAPLLIVHGEDDFLVSPAVAREHHRIAPHSELVVLEGDHFLLWRKPAELARTVVQWIERVEHGVARSRADATEERLQAAAEPFDPRDVPPFEGPALLILLLLVAASTLVSEDLACIAVGLLVAQGRVSFVSGTLAAFTGIFVGDVLLYATGRFFGRPALARAPLKWFIHLEDIERAKAWFARRGASVIFASRFVPGLRLPTYFVAGAVRASLLVFCFYFVIAGLLWTPLLVLIVAKLGPEVMSLERVALPALVGFAIGFLLLQRLVVPLCSWRGRRLLVGAWRRRTSFEFWPPWIFYLPVALRIAWLALRHRGLTVVTAVNPGMPTGGFIGESKSRILAAIDDGSGDVARHALIPASLDFPARLRAAREFLERHALRFPVVLKPDVGQRGSGVSILGDERALEVALDTMRVDSVLQEYAPGQELGVFWVHHPAEPKGRIFSITEKRLPVVVGDGERTLEELILADDRAVCMARTYFRINAARLLTVPAAGERVNLVELGTHCRGAIFLDGAWARTDALAEAIGRISARYPGFHFGRYDLRVRSLDELAQGRGFQVIELNGLTSEATHIYDPRTRLLEAWRVLFEQWRLAFEIGAHHRAAGARVWTLRELAHAVRAYKKLQAEHLPTGWQWGLAARDADSAPAS